jgi:hypothetical protein
MDVSLLVDVLEHRPGIGVPRENRGARAFRALNHIFQGELPRSYHSDHIEPPPVMVGAKPTRAIRLRVVWHKRERIWAGAEGLNFVVGLEFHRVGRNPMKLLAMLLGFVAPLVGARADYTDATRFGLCRNMPRVAIDFPV